MLPSSCAFSPLRLHHHQRHSPRNIFGALNQRNLTLKHIHTLTNIWWWWWEGYLSFPDQRNTKASTSQEEIVEQQGKGSSSFGYTRV